MLLSLAASLSTADFLFPFGTPFGFRDATPPWLSLLSLGTPCQPLVLPPSPLGSPRWQAQGQALALSGHHPHLFLSNLHYVYIHRHISVPPALSLSSRLMNPTASGHLCFRRLSQINSCLTPSPKRPMVLPFAENGHSGLSKEPRGPPYLPPNSTLTPSSASITSAHRPKV